MGNKAQIYLDTENSYIFYIFSHNYIYICRKSRATYRAAMFSEASTKLKETTSKEKLSTEYGK